MKRLEWLKRYYTALLEDFQKKNENGAELLVDDFVAADPSSNKKYTSWLIKTYIAKGFRSEDLSKATETLAEFVKHQHRLDIHQRDINSFTNLADVWIAVSPYVEATVEDLSVSGKEQKRRDKALAYEQSIILVDEQDFIAAVPLTEFASKWWGKGTRWCTAAENDNAFHQYHQKAPLIIFIFPNGRKMQMYVTDKDFQFMDENDAAVNNDDILTHWNFIESFLHWAIRNNGLVLHNFPEQHRTPELCLEAVRRSGAAVCFVPEQHRTFDIFLEAVRQSRGALYFIPEQHLTFDLCLEAVKQNGGALCYVPEKHLTFDLCLEAVRKGGGALCDVPEQHLTFELCLEAVRYDAGALRYTPKHYCTPELCLEAVRKSGLALRHVPDRHRTLDLCIEAVKQNREAVDYVPDNFYEEISRDIREVELTPNWLQNEVYFENLKQKRVCSLF